MSSVSFTPQSMTPRRGHGHRRSAAISGDFDAIGLGLFSPTVPSSAKATSSYMDKEYNDNDNHKVYEYNTNEDLDGHFNFNNEEDFCNRTEQNSFAFPNKTHSSKHPNSYSTSFRSPIRRHNHNQSLSSPIKLNHKKSISTSNSPSSNFFLTEETHFDEDNVPNAVIDLDEVINANASSENIGSSHKRTESAPPRIFALDEFLASPFSRSSPVPHASSPLSASNTLFHQPIKELVSDDMEDIDRFEHLSYNKLESSDNSNSDVGSTENVKPFYNSDLGRSSTSLHKQDRRAFDKNGYKSNISSSQSSIPHFSLAGKQYAKSSRYKQFYDQSLRVSSAMKDPTPESTDICRSDSSGFLTSSNSKRSDDAQALGHSSSLPSLKSNNDKHKVVTGKTQDAKNNSSNFSKPSSRKLNNDSLKSKPNDLVHKTLAGSPISINSANSSTVLSNNATTPSTGHSSLNSCNDASNRMKSSISTISAAPAIIITENRKQGMNTKSPSSGQKYMDIPKATMDGTEPSNKLTSEPQGTPIQSLDNLKPIPVRNSKNNGKKDGNRLQMHSTTLNSSSLKYGTMDDSCLEPKKNKRFVKWFKRK
ncbi:Piso0_005454 [Millerozyma farinosa CBS 7064]|uniref:Piso0_005454 protein n=1 Tax=Pichia sorbitophila (strain ATCC MYA-4447 / BCRC 22081 / CBS 7064 / NBRC 10061 / NRRL Y-12695) TaxID=559304 RepID=G8XZ22_PICSO|nr:Piso0_005454 [Millerozyma farinosa CBS 7064]